MAHQVSPLMIEIMLECYASAEPGANIQGRIWESDAAIECRSYLMDEGLIDAELRATERGQAWVEYICATPLPVQVWKFPERTTDIEGGE